jgi:uncharacterized RDD family membrane protein YckC
MADQPTQPGQPGYPPQAGQPGYPPQAGYPPQPGQPGYPQPGYPPQAGYPPQPGAYPPPGYPPQAGSYPPPAGYPPQQGYPGYAPVGSAPMPGTLGAPRYAGFWIRVAAYIIDGFVLFGLLLLCLVIIIIGWIALPFVLLGYMPWMWWKKGATLGQRAMGIRVVRAVDGGPLSGSQAVLRYIGFFASSAVFDLGFIWVAFEPRKRGWHDMIADTVVIHTN